MNENEPKINFTKRVVPRATPEERKDFNILESSFEEVHETIWKVYGVKYTLNNKNGELIGKIGLWQNDPLDDSFVKIKTVDVEWAYRGTGAINALYDQAVVVAREEHKDLVMDCKAGKGAYISFQRYAENHNLKLIKNEVTFNDFLQTYEAPDGTWTLKIILDK